MEPFAGVILGFLFLRFLVSLANLIMQQWLHNGELQQNPLVSILIPARNEENNLGELLSSIMKQDYQNYEVFVYDDLSEDNTEAIAKEYVKKDQRFHLITGEPLPEGWLGKNHACHQLSLHANGNYLLFMDADVNIKKGLIKNSLAHSKKYSLQLFSIFPRQRMHSFGEKITVPLMNWILLSLLPLYLIRTSSRKSLAAANGQFMLFDAKTYHKHYFHEMLKGHKVEDIAILKKMKAIGYSCHTVASNGQIECRMYKGFKDAAQGFPKNGFAAKRVALVIGNSNYRDAPLRNPANDASDIAAALKRLNFNVVLIKNASERDMKRAIRSFGQSLSAAEVRLFYYAGHGMQVRGTNYLIPLGAEVRAEDEVEYEAVDAGLVLSKMRSSSPGVNIILLDACRNNPFARSFRSGSRGLARMDAPTGTIIAYATAPGGVAADGSGRNGLFTKHLLKHIERKGMALDDVLRRVRKGVAQETSSKQVPWASESLLTEVFLCGPSGEMLADGSTYAAPADQSPKLGSLRIESQPTGADIFMNNKYIGISPLTLNDLSTGRVTIRAQKSGYSSREKVTSVLSGQTNFVSFPLSSVKRIASPARLYVSPYPEDAKIRILNIGPRYSRGMTLKPGRYHVEVSKPGYKTTRRWVTLSDGNLNVSINLEKRDSVSSKDIPVAQKSKYGPNLRRARARAESLRLTADRVLRPGDDLRQAVSGAKSGATFVLERGVYRVRGEWKIKRPVHLVGAGPDAVEIIIEKFSINAPGGMVKFEGLSVRMDSNLKRAAIYASNSNVLLENCRVSGAIYSGFESSGGRAVATACEITGNKAAGIFIYKGCKGTFRGNHIRNNDLQGISVKTDADALVEGNLIENNKQAGIYVYKNGKGT